VSDGEVRTFGLEACGVSDAASQKGVFEKRLGPHGEEPQAGNRNRVERGAGERRESPISPPFVVEEAVGKLDGKR
jgi:hypothetical protein